MVEPGEIRVKSEGVKDKKVFTFKKKNHVRNNNAMKHAD